MSACQLRLAARLDTEWWGTFLQVNIGLIVLFNYYYTFLQLDPTDLADQLKRGGGAIPAVRPGRATVDYVTKTLKRMSILGSGFLGALAATPPLVESITKVSVRHPPPPPPRGPHCDAFATSDTCVPLT